MRFLKSAARRIYRPIKSVVRRIPTGVWVAALTFFTAGVATVGFGAFTAAAGGGLGGFMGAVGTTTVAGAQSLAAAAGIGSGISSGVAAASGATAGQTLATGVASQALGLSAGPIGSSLQTTGLASQTLAGGQTVSSAQSLGASSGMLSNFFSGLNQATGGGEAAGTMAGMARRSMLMSGVQAGAQAYMQRSAERRQDKRHARLNFFGGPARGGSSELPFELPSMAQEGQGTTQSPVHQPTQPPTGVVPQVPPAIDFINQPTQQLFAGLHEEEEPDSFTPDFMRSFV